MKWTEQIDHARAQGDWSEMIQAVPFARFLDLRIDVEGEEFTCVLPFQEKLIGTPILPALHGGATGGSWNAPDCPTCCGTWTAGTCPRPSISTLITCARANRRTPNANAVMVKLGQRVANLRIQAW